LDIKVIVLVKDAFYANMFAAIVSQVASHFLLGIHRANEKAVLPENVTPAPDPVARLTFLFIVMLGIVVFVMAIVGSVVDSFAFTFSGAVDIALPPDQVEREFSMATLLDALGQASDEATGRDASSIQFTVALTYAISLIVPLINIIGLLVLSAILWVPTGMDVKRMNAWFVAVEGLSSWSALDVFTVSILAAVLQIEQFADVIVNSIDLPGVLDPFLAEEGGLFKVTATVNGIFALLVISSILLFTMNSMIQSRVAKKIDAFRIVSSRSLNPNFSNKGEPLLGAPPTPQNDF